MFLAPRTPVLLFAMATAALVACSDAESSPSGNDSATKPTSGTVPDPAIPVVTASTLEAQIRAAGFDPTNLPTWADVVAGLQKKKAEGGQQAVSEAARPIMTLFGQSLGIKCDGCHSDPGFVVPEARARVVAGMWDRFVRDMRLADGGTLFCDSCHQQKGKFLLREDNGALAGWMRENFVEKLTTSTGGAMQCASCHGEPYRGDILNAWAKGER